MAVGALRGLVKWVVVAVAAGGGGLALSGADTDKVTDIAMSVLTPMLGGVMPERAGANADGASSLASGSAKQRSFTICKGKARNNCVVDGDTFWIDGEKIRIVDLDTPETHTPRCAKEAELGKQATYRLQELLNAGPVTMEVKGRGQDQYGRALRVVKSGGRSVSDQLIAEGLARKWEGKRQPWC